MLQISELATKREAAGQISRTDFHSTEGGGIRVKQAWRIWRLLSLQKALDFSRFDNMQKLEAAGAFDSEPSAWIGGAPAIAGVALIQRRRLRKVSIRPQRSEARCHMAFGMYS